MAESESAAVWAAVAENDKKARKQWLAGYEAAKAQAAGVAKARAELCKNAVKGTVLKSVAAIWRDREIEAEGIEAAILAMEPRDENA